MTAKATEILEQNMQSGTGTTAQIGCPAAGKTGTTDEFTDAWFVGFTPRLATAVWVGYPNDRTQMLGLYHGANVAGGTFPAEIWGDVHDGGQGQVLRRLPAAQDAVRVAAVLRPATRAGGGKGNPTDGGDDGDRAAPTPAEPTPAPTTTRTTATTDDGRQRRQRQRQRDGNGNGDGDGFDPEQYEAPPQPRRHGGDGTATRGTQAPG